MGKYIFILCLFSFIYVFLKLSFWEYNLYRHRNNQKPYMANENQGCKMAYFIKIIKNMFMC